MSTILLIIYNYTEMANFILIFQIQGFCLILILLNFGTCIMDKRNINFIIHISNISYDIILYHHNIILG